MDDATAPADASGPQPETRLRLILADDDPFARRVLRDELQRHGFVVIAEASDGREAVELSSYYVPDVVLMDVVMPQVDGLEATSTLVARFPDMRIVLLTSNGEDWDLCVAGLRAGAVGWLSKDIDLEALPRIVAGAAAGEAVLSRRFGLRLVEAFRSARPDARGMRPVRSSLTSREWEVLDLLCEGRSTDEIVAELVLSADTVRSHVKAILKKLQVSSREEAAEVGRRLRGEPARIR